MPVFNIKSLFPPPSKSLCANIFQSKEQLLVSFFLKCTSTVAQSPWMDTHETALIGTVSVSVCLFCWLTVKVKR